MTGDEKRAKRVARAIRTEYRNDSRGICREDIVDLITDVMYLCDFKRNDFDAILESASKLYHEEPEL